MHLYRSLLIAALCCVSLANATIRYVSPNPGSAPYATITAAHTAAVTGDTIVVGPGNYPEALAVTAKKVHLIGAGWDICTWQGYLQFHNAFANGSAVEGFRFTAAGSHSVYCVTNVDSITVRRCFITPSASLMSVYAAAGRMYVSDCVLNSSSNAAFYIQNNANGNIVVRNTVFNCITPNNAYTAITGINNGTVEIYNCAFLNFTRQFDLTGVPQVIGLNNIFWDWNATATYGNLPVGSVFEYTAAGQGSPTFPANFSNNISLGTNNPFVNYDNTSYTFGTTNLHLNTNTGGNLCRDTGYPSIQDLDSTASDLGVYGGPKPMVDLGIPAFPFALSLVIDNLVEVGDSVNVTSTGRIGPRY